MKNIEKGMTLIELTVVLLILIALAGIAIPYVSGTSRMAMCQATDATLQAVKEAIMGGGAGPGFYGDTLGYYPKNTKTGTDYNLHYLFEIPTGGGFTSYNPKTAVGWRGPYLMSGGIPDAAIDNSFALVYPGDVNGTVHASAKTADSQVLDAWHRPIIIQIPHDGTDYLFDYARLVSAGPGNGIKPGDAVINTKIKDTVSPPQASDRSDDRVLYLKMPDPYANGNTPCVDYD